MKDLVVGKFTFDAYSDLCIVDHYGNRWSGDSEVNFVWITFDSGVMGDCSILRLNDEHFHSTDITSEEFDQLGSNVTEDEVIKHFTDNRDYFLEVYSHILNNPELNGIC